MEWLTKKEHAAVWMSVSQKGMLIIPIPKMEALWGSTWWRQLDHQMFILQDFKRGSILLGFSQTFNNDDRNCDKTNNIKYTYQNKQI